MRSPAGRTGCRPILLALLLSGWGCASQDIHRPIVFDDLPSKELYAEVFADVPAPRVVDARADTGKARRFFDIQAWDDRTSYLYIRSLLSALEVLPDDPHAWHQLGVYLALQHRFDAALEATETGLRLIGELEGESPALAADFLGDLRARSLINLGIYNTTAGRYEAALDALERVESVEEIQPFLRLAFYWTATLALSGAGHPEAARDALGQARKVPDSAFGVHPQGYDYKQYFTDRKREGMHTYLEGLIELESGQADKAAEILAPLVARGGPGASSKKPSDPKNYDARIAYVNALAEAGELENALSELERLIDSAPRGAVARREVLFYNLGNMEADSENLAAAREAYLEAIGWVAARNDRYCDKLERELARRGCDPRPACGVRTVLGLEVAPDPRTDRTMDGAMRLVCSSLAGAPFTAAHSNLANLLAEAGNLEAAEAEYRHAIEGADPDIARIARHNLARLLIGERRWQEALSQVEATLAHRPEDPAARSLLVDLAEGAEPTTAGRAAELEVELRELVPSAGEAIAEAIGNLPDELTRARLTQRLEQMETRAAGDEIPPCPDPETLTDRLRALDASKLVVSLESARSQMWCNSGSTERADPSARLEAALAESEGADAGDLRDASHLLARLHFAAGRLAQAREAADRALALDPEWPPARVLRSWIARQEISGGG